MKKSKILKLLEKKLIQNLDISLNNLETTQNLIQKGDLKSDGKYDTRALEVNYLADGQRKRVTELKNDLSLLKKLPVKSFDHQDFIQSCSGIVLELNNKKINYFLSPCLGGTMLNIDNNIVMVISSLSPIGKELLGHKVDDEIEVELNNKIRTYKIISHY